MNTVRSKAILLHQIPYSESSKILKAYCRSSGLTSLIAKGAARPKSKFRGQLQLFTLLELVYPKKDPDQLAILQEASVLASFGRIQGDLQKQALANVWLEIYLRHLYGAESAEPLYELLESHLKNLEEIGQLMPHLMCDFIMQFCGLMGFRPQFDSCVHCGETDFSALIHFDLAMGGPACGNCLSKSPHYVKSALKLLRWLDSLQIFGSYSARPGQAQILRGEELLLQFLYHQSSRSGPLKSYTFYKKLLNFHR